MPRSVQQLTSFCLSRLRSIPMAHVATVALAFGTLTVVTEAQVSGSAGPQVAPMKTTIQIAIANDTGSEITLPNPCPFYISDSAGNVIFQPQCPAVIVRVKPGEVHRMTWGQRTSSGQRVLPGVYRIDFEVFNLGPQSIRIDQNADAGLTVVGPLRMGTSRQLFLSAPDEAGRWFVAAAALSANAGIATCGGIFPLDADPLLRLSLRTNNGIFNNFVHQLDASGETLLPQIAIPEVPGFGGLQMQLAFVTLDLEETCPLRVISPSLAVLVQ